MAKTVLYATGFFNIGDMFLDAAGNPHTITNILVCHYMKDGAFKVLYEMDDSGEFVEIRPQDTAQIPRTSTKTGVLQMDSTAK